MTFLFTDVQGSTTLLNAHPDAYRNAVRRHHALLLETVGANDGVVFETLGDSVCAAFAKPTDAVRAALHGQLALAREAWGETPIRVRMGIHLGEVEVYGDGGALRSARYFGLPLTRCARIMDAAHGGQVVLSGAAIELVRGALPEHTGLVDLGEHRLKSLDHPERIFQLTHPELESDFPPLRSLDALPNNLPLQLTALIGREAELAAIERLLSEHRLVTLTGPGGTGKTRLALQAAADMLDQQPDGVWFVDLSAIHDPALVPRAIAASVRAVRVREEAERPLVETLATALAPRSLLLVLDNCEHLLVACADAADHLLRACPLLRVLTTSRQPLHIYGEQELPVPPLELPVETTTAALRAPAVALFIQRAQAVRPDAVPTPEDVRCIVEICRRLDGLPLAIELAAARTRLFSPQALLARLLGTYGQTPLRLLTGGAQTLPPRQQTLRGAIEWSYQLLAPPEQTLFRRLAVFAGGASFEAVETVVGASTSGVDVLDGLESLVEKSLVKQSSQPDGEPRFTLLEMIREFGLELLDATCERDAAVAAHAIYFTELAKRAESRLWQAEQQATLAALGRDHANLRQALARLAGIGHASEGLQLAAALWRFWDLTGLLTEGRGWLERLLALPPPSTADLEAVRVYEQARISGLVAAGSLALGHDDYDAGTAAFEEVLALSERIADRVGIAAAHDGLGEILRYRGEHEVSLRHHVAALPLWRELGDRARIAHSLYCQGVVTRFAGNGEAARALFEESLAIRRELGDQQGAAWCAHQLGVTAQASDDLASARRYFAEGLRVRRAIGDRLGAAYSLTRLAYLAIRAGEHPSAASMLVESISIAIEFGDKWQVAYALEILATACHGAGDPFNTLRAASASHALLRSIGAVADPTFPVEREAAIGGARSALSTASAEAAWHEGQALQLAEIAALARTAAEIAAALPAPTAAPLPSIQPARDALTRREREVAALVAEGLTNRQIAERLVISERTADTHVQNILGKLGFATRSQVAVWSAGQD